MWSLHLFARLALIAVFSFVGHGQPSVDFYRPLYEAQRGPLSTPNINVIKQECVDGWYNLSNPHTLNQFKAIDAIGKPSSGILVGSWAWYGHFSECSNMEEYRYCLVILNIPTDILGEFKNVGVSTLKEIIIDWGVCAPTSCSPEEVQLSLQDIGDIIELSIPVDLANVTAAVKCVEKPVVRYSPGFYICLVICSTVGFLMIGGSIIDVVEKRSQADDNVGLSVQSGDVLYQSLVHENGNINGGHTIHPLSEVEADWKIICRKIGAGIRLLFLDFALNRNLSKLMTIGESNDRNIDCLNGIRVLSMFWVILGHTYFFPFTYRGIFNLTDALGWTKNFFLQIILNGYFSVDSFFFISGLLVCYLTLIKLEKKNGRLPWHLFYLHRYLRLTPVMLVTIMVWMYIAPYTMWGPKAALMAERPNCPNNWWANALYIQNFYPPHFGQACIAWTWYLANDMQFYIISPLIIYALYRIPYVGFALLGSLLAMSFAVTATLIAYFDLGATPSDAIVNTGEVTVDYGNIVYQKPYVRIPPYLVGMCLGYVMYRLKDRHVIIPRSFLALGWLLAAGVGMATLFGLYRSADGHPLSEGGNIAYEMFSRFSWGVFLSWVVVACKYGRPGWINDILSWKLWIPLSRLTYTAYLLHPIVITTFLGNSGVPYYMSNVLQTFYFFGMLLMSYTCAMLMSLAVEYPLVNIEMHFMPKM